MCRGRVRGREINLHFFAKDQIQSEKGSDPVYGARFSTGVYTRGVPLSCTPSLRLKRASVRPMKSLSVFGPLSGWHCKLCRTTEGAGAWDCSGLTMNPATRC
jgi:hypothetical protein